jgi:hypothetical protein
MCSAPRISARAGKKSLATCRRSPRRATTEISWRRDKYRGLTGLFSKGITPERSHRGSSPNFSGFPIEAFRNDGFLSSTLAASCGKSSATKGGQECPPS